MNPMFIYVLGAVIISTILQSRLKVPLPVTLILLTILCHATGIMSATVPASTFDSIVLITLPLLIAADAFKIDLQELKRHALSVFTLAVLVVGASVLLGTLSLMHMPFFKDLPVAAIVIVLAMVCATDPVTVSSIFSSFKVPHDLKMLTEGESLFNDATALIIYSIALVTLTTGDVASAFIAQKTATVIFGALGVGLVVGAIGYVLLTATREPFTESACLMLTAYASYGIAEHFHFSGILAIIVSCLFANYEINKTYQGRSSLLDFNISIFREQSVTLHNMQIIHKLIDFIALMASGVLFISIGYLFNAELFMIHLNETLLLFALTTVIRFVLMFSFSFSSFKTSKMPNVPKSWVGVLTFAGSKGGLSVLMVHMLPDTLAWKPAIEQIVIGNILLSILVYAPILLLIFKVNKQLETETSH